MRGRTALLLLAALVLLFAGAAALVVRLTEPGGLAGGPAPAAQGERPPEVVEAPPTGLVTPAEVADPVQARRLELLIEARSRYRSLRDGFKGPASEPSRQRLEPALRSLWPAGSLFTLACRGRVCMVEGPGAAAEWQPALQAHPEVVAAADQVVVDPDGVERPAYLRLSPGRAGSGDDFLGGFERSLREAVEDEGCPTGQGTIDYELSVDESGITYRAGGTAPQEAIDCVGRVLAERVTSTRVPPATKAATRTVSLGAGR